MIHFVGAGPGDPEFLTIRGARLLAEADLIIYAGSLVNRAVLGYAKDGARVLDSAYMTLEEVISEMCEAERDGLSTVRLHTGDPSIYGAIREQIDELKKAGIAYDVTPGVSSFAAAAATLGAEYTLPNVSQSLILTRIAGRTDVPERESIASFAAHHSSMAIFLSAGHLAELSSQLIEGGFSPDTPAAIVYKASWPEEKTIRCTISELVKCAVEEGIDRTALILVGDFLGDEYERSKLYDPEFTTGYRGASSSANCVGEFDIEMVVSDEPDVKSDIACICFTDRGEETADRIATSLDMVVSRSGQDMKVMEWTDENFDRYKALVFIGATGIATRAIAEHVKSKTSDPAVICIDEAGRFVIPILSGHIGGANKLAQKIADILGAQAVLTTATDGRGAFAIDSWAVENGLVIRNPERIVDVSSKILDENDEGISIRSCLPIEGEIPKKVKVTDEEDADVTVDISGGTDHVETLHLIPRVSVLGVGCRRGTDAESIEAAFAKLCDFTNIYPEAFCAVASIDLKSDEKGLVEFCEKMGLPFLTYDADELKEVRGDFTPSVFVEDVTGVDNVCERSAVRAAEVDSGSRAELIAKKTVIDGITFAVAKKDVKLHW